MSDHPVCPVCGEKLRYRDSRKRIRRKEGGHVEYLEVRRLLCPHCRKLHVELPDCLVPHKHYDAEVISGVIEGIVTPDDLDSEDHPCAATMRRWIKWFLDNRTNIEGLLRRAFRIAGRHLPASAESSYLTFFQEQTSCWLETIIRIIYNSGGWIPTGSG